jgi:DNA-binding MarR family transcriptional regulator
MIDKENISEDVQELAANFLRIFKLATKPELPNEMRHRQFHFMLTLVKQIKPGQEGIKPSDLSDPMHISRSAVTHTLNHMEESGLVERTPDPGDRRNVLVKPTPEGMRVLDEAYAAVLSRLTGLTEYLGEADTRELNRILTKSIPYLREHAEKNQSEEQPRPWSHPQ